jgi:hypothetical protein
MSEAEKTAISEAEREAALDLKQEDSIGGDGRLDMMFRWTFHPCLTRARLRRHLPE